MGKKKMAYQSRLTSLLLNNNNEVNNNSNSDMNINPQSIKNIKLKYLGDEWANDEDVIEILNEYILPYINLQSKCIEIGSGGGRICARIINKINKLFCLDISKKMLEICQKKLLEVTHQDLKNTEFILLKNDNNDIPYFPLHNKYDGHIDYIYSFDVFVHLDIHTQYNYLQQCYQLLNFDGYLFIHTSNLQTDLGWQRFSHQHHASVAGFYFVVPSMIDLLLEITCFVIVRRSTEELKKKKKIFKNFFFFLFFFFFFKKKKFFF